jgi:hypothetical protein
VVKVRARDFHDYGIAISYLLLVLGAPVLYSGLVMSSFSSPKLAVVCVAAALGAMALILRWTPLRSVLGPTGLLLLAAGALATLSLAFSPILGVSFWGRHNQEVGYLAVLACLVLYGVGISVVSVLPRWPGLLYVALIPAVGLSVMLVARLAGVPLPSAFLAPDGSAPVLTMGNSIHVGAYLAAMAAFGLALGVSRAGRSRLALLAISAILGLGTVLSRSTPAVLALVLGVAWVAWRRLDKHPRARVGILAGALGLTLASAVVAYAGSGSALGQVFDPLRATRPENHLIALETIFSHPLFGVGPANFQGALVAHLTPTLVHSTYATQIAGDAQSWPLEMAATYGLPFALLVAYLFLAPVVRPRGLTFLQQPFAAGVVALAVTYFFGPLALSTLPLLALFAGAVAGRPPVDEPSKSDRRSFLWMARSVILVAVAALLILGGVHFLRIDYELKQADLAQDPVELTAAADRLFPATPPPYWAAGSLAAYMGRVTGDAAQSADVDRLFARAKALDPTDPLTELNWAIALQVLDRHVDAIGHLLEASRLYPNWPLAEKGIAFSYLQLKQPELALPILEKLAGLYPGDARVKQLLDQARSAAQ